MQSRELRKNRGWDRSSLDVHKLSELAWSIKTNGWSDGHPVVYETLPTGEREILWGHRRTLAASIANSSNGVMTIEEMVTYVSDLATVQVEATVCPACGSEVDESQSVCYSCSGEIWEDAPESEDGVRFLGIPGKIDVVDMGKLVRNYNQIIADANVEVPTEEKEYESELNSQLLLIGDGMGREDSDILGMAAAIQRAYSLGGDMRQLSGLGLTLSEIQSYIAITQLPPRIGQLVAAGDIAMSIPRKIVELEDKNQRAALSGMINSRTTVRFVDSVVRRMREYEMPSQNMLASQPVNNKAAIASYVASTMIKDEPVAFWALVGSGRDMPVPDDIYTLIPQVSCDSCPLKGRMKELPKIHAYYGGYPCQNGEALGCVNAGPEVYADYTVRTEADVEYSDGFYFSTIEKAIAAYGQAFDTASENDTAGKDQRPIDDQRNAIREFVKSHTEAKGAKHPLATLCAECGFRTEGSPVKSDLSAPPCMWAKKRAKIDIGFLVDEKGYAIPNCRQYAPTADFAEMIPGTDPGKINEKFLDRAIDILVAELEQVGVQPLRRLTGIPFKASERFADWFRKAYDNATVSVEQKATLVNWLLAEIDIAAGRPAFIQLARGRVGAFGRCSKLPT